MTDDEYRAWLARDNEKRCILVELDYMDEVAGAPVLKTLYFSDRVFFDVVTNAVFVDVIRSAPQFSRALSGEQLGNYASSIDSLELHNEDGELDFMESIACDGSQVRHKYGGENWPLADFRTIHTSIAAKVSAPAIDRISVALKDTGLLLDKSIGGTSTVGGTGANADRPRPVAFGYVHNMTPLLLDQTIGGGKYVYADDGTGATCEQVRDDGVSVAYTDNLDGTFTLTAPPVGLITADVLAEPLGSSNVTGSDALEHIVGTRAGLTAESLYDGAGPTFDVHDADDYKLGILLPEARNVIDLLATVNVSLNSFWAGKRDGKFTFGRLRLNDIASFGLDARAIVADDIDQGSFRLEHSTPQYYKYQGYMSRNQTRQTNLAASLTQNERAQYERSGLYLLQPDGATTAYLDRPELYHKTLATSPVVDTLLSQDFAAAPADLDEFAQWMTVRRAMFLPWVEVVTIVVGIEFFELELGDPVSLTISEADGATRYGISDTLFQVIGIVIRLTDAKIELKLARRTVIQPVPAAWHRTVSAIDDAPPDYPRGATPSDPEAPRPPSFTLVDLSTAGLIRGGNIWVPDRGVIIARPRKPTLTLMNSVLGGSPTSPIDTSGANVLVVVVSAAQVGTGTFALSDNKGNAWNPRTARFNTGGMWIRQFDVLTGAIVGAGHTFSFSNSGAFPTVMVLAFYVSRTATFGTEGGSASTVGSDVAYSPGSGLAASTAGAILVCGWACDRSGLLVQINSGFSIAQQVGFNVSPTFSEGGAIAWRASAGGAINPVWSAASGGPNMADHASVISSINF